MFWHKAVCKIFGIKIVVRGQYHYKQQCLYISNHISYLDIPVIGSVLKACFIAKSEVEGWPVFGFLSKLQRTIFIKRDRKAFHDAKEKVKQRLDNGQSLILFPEGTSTNGETVAPFKSSLFTLITDAKDDDNIALIPFTIKIEKINGKDIQSLADHALYAWYDDMELAPHLWALALGKGATISLNFHSRVATSREMDRKALAELSHKIIKEGLHSKVIN
jgi:1-acyl-sn-glycerol-3-phosphate acyltransferase